jgi:hypothetical protein
MMLICAVSPRANGRATDQKCQVRMKFRVGGAPPPDAVSLARGAGASPSGPSPSDSGPRTSSHSTSGVSTTTITVTRESTASSNPIRPTRNTSAGTSRTPPTAAPLNAMLIARPRLRSNQGATMTLRAAPLMAAHPPAISGNTM